MTAVIYTDDIKWGYTVPMELLDCCLGLYTPFLFDCHIEKKRKEKRTEAAIPRVRERARGNRNGRKERLGATACKHKGERRAVYDCLLSRG